MEKGTLRIFNNKNGVRSAELIIGDNQRIPLHNFDFGDWEDGEHEVYFKKREKKANGECPYIISTENKGNSGSGGHPRTNSGNSPIPEQIAQVRVAAKAPYNFVPLNPADGVFEVQRFNQFNRYFPATDGQGERSPDYPNTGWIDLDIETRTPVYIRDSQSREEARNARKGVDQVVNSSFFSPGGRARIPGSSLRGMIRQMVEITGFGRFGCYHNRHLYYRAMADKSSLRNEYRQRMTSSDRSRKRATYNSSAGVIVKRGNSYVLLKSSKAPQQILKKEAKELVKKLGGGVKYEDHRYYDLGSQFLVVSGPMPNKRRDWLIEKPGSDTEPTPLDQKDIESYLSDNSRADQVMNLIHEAAELAENGAENGVPCFYVLWNDGSKDRVNFGHTGMFRLAYEKPVAGHIPGGLQPSTSGEGGLSLAESIFGTVFEGAGTDKDTATAIAGRVFVEDAFIQQEQDDVYEAEGVPQILSSPKPTTFQHYLVQTSDNVRSLNHYNSDTVIRGNKLYWHQSGNKWREEDEKNKKAAWKQYTKIRPVKSGIRFRGRIRFENLSDVELGALLFSLRLPDGCCHKIGMGKPLGLGSVHLKPTLYLSNRRVRYTSLFSEWGNQIDASAVIPDKIRVFEKAVYSRIGEDKLSSLWESDRLRDLRVLLHVDTGKMLEKADAIRYMTIRGNNEFRNRNVLPAPQSVAANIQLPPLSFDEHTAHPGGKADSAESAPSPAEDD